MTGKLPDLTNYLDVLDDLLVRVTDAEQLAEEMGREAHKLFAGRLAQALRDGVYKLSLDLSAEIPDALRSEAIALAALVETTELALASLEPYEVDEEPEDDNDDLDAFNNDPPEGDA